METDQDTRNGDQASPRLVYLVEELADIKCREQKAETGDHGEHNGDSSQPDRRREQRRRDHRDDDERNGLGVDTEKLRLPVRLLAALARTLLGSGSRTPCNLAARLAFRLRHRLAQA